jgi:hypothetical protein
MGGCDGGWGAYCGEGGVAFKEAESWGFCAADEGEREVSPALAARFEKLSMPGEFASMATRRGEWDTGNAERCARSLGTRRAAGDGAVVKSTLTRTAKRLEDMSELLSLMTTTR